MVDKDALSSTADVWVLVERLLDISQNDDHARGCQGRQYTCSCGFDDRAFATADEAASLIQSQAAESAADKARIAELEAALKPFAAEASEWSWKFADGQRVSSRPGPPHDEDETAKFTVGDLRTARRLLNGECKASTEPPRKTSRRDDWHYDSDGYCDNPGRGY